MQDIATGARTYYALPARRRSRRGRALAATDPNATAGSAGVVATVSVGSGDSQSPAAVADSITAAFESGLADDTFANATQTVRSRYAPADNATAIVYLLQAVQVRPGVGCRDPWEVSPT